MLLSNQRAPIFSNIGHCPIFILSAEHRHRQEIQCEDNSDIGPNYDFSPISVQCKRSLKARRSCGVHVCHVYGVHYDFTQLETAETRVLLS